MHYSRAQLTEMLADADELPEGEAQVTAIEEVIRHAEAAGLVEVEIQARLDLVDAKIWIADDFDDLNEVIAAFTRCVTLYGAHPDKFDEDLLDALWRQFAAQGLTMSTVPGYPLRLLEGVFGDMERRALAERDDLHTIHSVRLQLAESSGDTAMGDRSLAEVQNREPADYGCAACLSLNAVRFLAAEGRHEEAIAAAGPALSGELPCHSDDQPADTLALLQVSYLYTGALEEARDAHRWAYRHHEPGDETGLAMLLRFCVLTGNTERGLQILTRNLSSLETTPIQMFQMERSAAAAAVCRTLLEEGRGEEKWRWPANPDVPGDEDEEWTYQKLYDELLQEAMGLAGQFDERNGHSRIGDRMRAIVEEQPLVDGLAISPLAARRKEIIQPRPDSPPADERPAAPEEAADGEAAWLDAHAEAIRYARRGDRLLDEGRAEESVGEFIEASARFTALGETRLAMLTRVDLATAYVTLGRALDAAECAEEALPDVPPDLDAEYTGIQVRWVLACAYPEIGQPEEALAMLAEMRDRDSSPGTLAKIDKKTGEILNGQDRDEEAARHYLAAAGRYAELGDRYEQAVCLRAAALALTWSDQNAEALATLAEARLIVADLPADQERIIWERAVQLFDEARILSNADRPAEGAEAALESAEIFRAIEDAYFATRADLVAGQLLHEEERFEEAEAALRRAVAEPAVDGDHQSERVNAGGLLAALLDELGRADEAARVRTEMFG